MTGTSSETESEPRWYALAVHARQEKAAAAAVEELGIEVFLPTRVERRTWSDRVKDVEVALFPGYIFLQTAMTAASRASLLGIRQAIDLVGRLPGGHTMATPIPSEQIESLRVVVESAVNLDPVARLIPGTPVLVATGALRGVRGVVVEEKPGARRLVVQVELLGRGVSTDLAADVLVEAPDSRSPPGSVRGIRNL